MSLRTYISPISYIFIKGVKPEIAKKIQNVKFAYDHTLTYEETVKSIKSKRSKDTGVDRQTFPIFSFLRKPITSDEHLTFQKSKGVTAFQDPVIGNLEIKFARVKIPFEYKIFSNSMEDIEEFELLYSVNHSINSIRNFKIDYPYIGEFEYNIRWGEELDEIEMNKEESINFSIGGSFDIEGLVFVYTGDANLIEAVRLEGKRRFEDVDPNLLFQGSITV